jgi:hypothetical protein
MRRMNLNLRIFFLDSISFSSSNLIGAGKRKILLSKFKMLIFTILFSNKLGKDNLT